MIRCLTTLSIVVALGAMTALAMELDPTTVTRTGKANDFLICHEGACASASDAVAARFQISPEQLVAAWRDVIRAEPRTTIVAEDPAALTLVATQSSRMLGFVDEIGVRVIRLADGGSSFAAYSRSRVGYWDMGVNRARLERWIAAVTARLG